MQYELFYWPSIQGRGEFVRLALEDAGADYIDVARESGPAQGIEAMVALMDQGDRPPFAPPFLRVDDLIVAQTANILFFLGPALGLVPTVERERLWAHQLQLTVTDFVAEIHNVHHPLSAELYYEDQAAAAAEAATCFLEARMPRFMGYFESVLQAAGGHYLLGERFSYVDLSVFQLIAGLRYAFPNVMARDEGQYPGVMALHDSVTSRPNIAAYLASPRRIAFNEEGIFRHYPELDI